MQLWLRVQSRGALRPFPSLNQRVSCFHASAQLDRGGPKGSSKGGSNDKPFYNKWAGGNRIRRGAIIRKDGLKGIVRRILGDLKQDFEASETDKNRFNEFADSITKLVTGNYSPFSVGESQKYHTKLHLENAFYNEDLPGVKKELRSKFLAYKLDSRFMTGIEDQKALVDFRYPTEWYPVARTLQRRVHLHVGPTNSGKTYHALKRLETAKSGFYAGPLRLLAHEVYARFKAKGISCGLVTGDEVKVSEEDPPSIYSNTVEMAMIGQEVEVGVIDEIQMIGDAHRGWAWTRAFLGSQAHELHLCGEERAIPLIRELTSLTGDNLEIHRYTRLNPLKPMTTSLKGDLSRLQKGDCVVAFSRITIHALKREIEKSTGRRVAIVYGSLPAEIRTQQTDLFNDPNNDYDFLVSSDAIGMGLNLSCKRIIFETSVKRMPGGLQRLNISQVKQIGGRAGRYRTAAQAAKVDADKVIEPEDRSEVARPSDQNVGYVTCVEDQDLPYIQGALEAQPEPITAAGLLPPDYMIENFNNYFPTNTPFSYILDRLYNLASTSSSFFMCSVQDMKQVSELLDEVEGLSAADKIVFLNAPLKFKDKSMVLIIKSFATCVAQHKSGALLDIPEIDLEILDIPVSGNKEYLRSLEVTHSALTLYLWLSFRCGGVFTERTLATHVKGMVERKMDRALTEFSANSQLRTASTRTSQMNLARLAKLADQFNEDEDPEGDAVERTEKLPDTQAKTERAAASE